MASQITDDDLPSGVQVARFMRLRLNIGFVGGQEKTVEYDTRKKNDETGEIQFRTYIERNSEYPPEGVEDGDFSLQDVARRRATLRVLSDADISYTEYVGETPMYLVTWDFGRTIRIMDEDEMTTAIAAIASQQDRLRAEDLSSLGGISIGGFDQNEPRSGSDEDPTVSEAPPEDDQPSSPEEAETESTMAESSEDTVTERESDEEVTSAPPSIE